MNIKKIIQNGKNIAVIESNDLIITDTQSMLDLIATIQHYHDCDRFILQKSSIAEDFFKLSTGMAGEILQKVVNYGKAIAIIGDFTAYTSKPLHDFIYESNKGKHVFFADSEAEAINRLSI